MMGPFRCLPSWGIYASHDPSLGPHGLPVVTTREMTVHGETPRAMTKVTERQNT
jgi:hypothetical protein